MKYIVYLNQIMYQHQDLKVKYKFGKYDLIRDLKKMELQQAYKESHTDEVSLV